MAAAAKQSSETSLDALEREYVASHKPRPAVYWGDLLVCVALGWSAFALAVASWGPVAWIAFAVAVLALYRAALFIHELAHLSARAVPGFTLGWDLLAGFPLLAPSLMYVGSHGEHHKAHLFGTAEDPEYAPIAHWSFARILDATLGLLLVPAALIVRWGALVPLGLVIPPVRAFARERLSTLVINAAYERKPPLGKLAKRWRNEELACALVVWSAGAALALGTLPLRALALWYALLASILMINHVRTLGAHRYENDGAVMSRDAQVADSLNLWGPAWLRPFTALAAPVGLRFHALHHLFPTLPYHALGAVHRRLMRELPVDASYRSTEAPALASALRDLAARVARSAQHAAP
ncbi:MAG: fatty acid desaturase [Deltaproteobacteria bacterium]|nr:fatty acid desaturase [Deltaproteobacteria bacterium]